MKLSKLFEPCHIGRLELKNRLIMSPCTTNFAKGGFVTDRMKNYYATIAKGGVGMIVVEDVVVESSLGRHTANDILIDDEKYVSGLAELANCIKAHGARTAIQLNHGGARAGKIINGYLAMTGGKLPVAPSSVAFFEPGYIVPRELTAGEIEDIIDKFAAAALRVKGAGFETMGIHCSHGYLVNQFLSPFFNHRGDEYGGSFEGRLRFVLRIIEEVQKRIGKDYPLFCRLSGDEPFEGGLNLQDTKQVAHRLEEAGIKAFLLSRGAARAPAATSKSIGSVSPMRIPRGCLVYLAEGIKQAVQVPVITDNRINDPVLAERILEDGKADLIAMGRALIADPEFPNKAKDFRLEEIRTCIACMWCSEKIRMDTHVACAINAQVGREIPCDLQKVNKPKKVLIIGGGPAGMEAARVAATRGHEVHLYESGPELGGQLLLAATPPGKQEINELIRYFRSEISRLGINVQTNTLVTSKEIGSLSPDVVIIATGSKPRRLPIPGIDQSNVVLATEVLQDAKEIGARVVVLGGGQVGCEVAEYLTTKGNDVTIVEMLDQLATDSPVSLRTLLLLSLKENGVKILTRAKAERIVESGLVVNKSGREEVIPADSIVLALGAEPCRTLADVVVGHSVLWIGDCVQPRNILEAVHEGFEAGVAI